MAEHNDMEKLYIVPQDIVNHILLIIDYGIADEGKHFQECDEPDDHIYHSFSAVSEYLINYCDNDILFGKGAQKVCEDILKRNETLKNGEKYPRPYVAGVFQEDDHWTAFDNTTGDCWVEAFGFAGDALRYARGEVVKDVHDNDVG